MSKALLDPIPNQKGLQESLNKLDKTSEELDKTLKELDETLNKDNKTSDKIQVDINKSQQVDSGKNQNQATNQEELGP